MEALPPDPSKDYPLVLGETFEGKNLADYHLLQYKFKPQSAGRRRPGSLSITPPSVSLEVPNAVEGMPDLGFEGQWAATQEGLDCVALFDGSCWRLELLSGIATNIRHTSMMPVRQEKAATQSSEPGGSSAQPGLQREPSAVPQGGAVRESITPTISLPHSATPSLARQLSTTPSMSRQVSRETSPSTEQPQPEPQRQASPGIPAVACQEPLNSHEAAQPSRGSPSIPPPNSMLENSTSSASTTSDEEEVVEQPVKSPQTKAELKRPPAPASTEKRPDFEREFFQDNSSSSDDDSQNNASDSSDNESEEEAKHF